MDFLGVNIKTKREERGWTQQKLAEEASVSQTTIDKIERGLTRKSKFLPEIAKSLGVSLDDLYADPLNKKLSQWGQERKSWLEAYGNRPKLPVFATFEGRSGYSTVGTSPISEIGRPSFLENINGAYCLYISSESMFPEYEPGDIAFINPSLPPIMNTTCLLTNYKGELSLFKRLMGHDGENWILKQWNPLSQEAVPAVDWPTCHRAVGKYARR